MKSNRYSLYKLNNETVSLFDSSQYSLLKFGHKRAIRHFADKLFHLIVDLHLSKSDSIFCKISELYLGKMFLITPFNERLL